jgi:hypothetical protein
LKGFYFLLFPFINFSESGLLNGLRGIQIVFSDLAPAPAAMRSCSGERGIRLMAVVVGAHSSESHSTRDSDLPEAFV